MAGYAHFRNISHIDVPDPSPAMHRQQSTHTLRSLRHAAVHFIVNVLTALAAAGLLAAGAMTGDKGLLWSGVAAAAFFAVSTVVFFLATQSWRCPLCLGKLWVRTGCSRHRKVKPALGASYRLGIALSVVFRTYYRCPYCGEPFSSRKAHR